MSNVFKVFSALLSYPTPALKDAAAEIRAVVHADVLGPIWAIDKIDRLLEELETQDIYELQERYVFLFDRTRSLSLHLFEHVHGESRDRGQAMVDLKELYTRGGLDIDTNELPDFLPLFLEYLSTRPQGEARRLLEEPIAVLVALKERLSKRKSPYAAIFAVLEAMANAAPSESDIAELRRAPDDDPNDLDALDKAWADDPVVFGPSDSNTDCPKVSQMLDRINAIEKPGDIARTARS